MDKQLSFLQMWQRTLQPIVDEVLKIIEANDQETADRLIEELFQRAVDDVRAFMPEDSSHGFLEEMVITGTHYINLMYNYGVFDNDSHT